MRRDVRILLVGDEGVGKSTIITSLIKESFVAHVQHVVPEVTIPPEVTPENVTTYIVDSGAGPQDRQHLESEIRKAHVICVVYSIDNPNSFDRIPAFWLPHFRQLGVNVPVILEVETCVECSAKLPLNVSEVFYFAQKAVLHPTAPLYDSKDHVLKPACVNALKRIFKLCDANKDGVLDAAELNEFQRKCFDAPLQLQELEGIREMVREHAAEGVRDNGLTEAGFLYLHTIFIQRGRLETTWTVLRKFGYGEDLKLTESFLFPKLDVPHDCSVELSPKGYQFFTDIFETFDKDQDGALNMAELEELFSTSPGNPWANQKFPDTTLADDSGAVTLQGWLAQWSMTTLLDHKVTLAYLAYLGYLDEPRTSALHTTRPRKLDRRKGKVTRNVFLCYVCGAAGSGKSSLLRSFAGKPFREAYEPTSKILSVVNAVDIDGSEKYLVLDLADLIIYVYDSSDTNSFSYISNLRQHCNLDRIPTLFVATKSDLDLAQQRHEVQPDVYCRRLGLQVPVAVSVKTGRTADVFHEMCRIAMNPHAATPGGAEHALTCAAERLRMYVTVTALLGGCSAGLVMLYRSLLRPGTPLLPGWTTHWAAWLLGRRDL
ncbi:EF hand associated-domain-containing protein [Pisolithus tinctorius]|nr:EF hand associated-domain-containing protein [Pisolithus tinctorius]